MFKLERRFVRVKDQHVECEVVYGVTSLTGAETSPARLLQLQRAHWQIENGLHYRRDRTLHEDATRISHPKLAEAIAIINNLVIGLVKWRGYDNLAAARRFFSANVEDALDLLLTSNS